MARAPKEHLKQEQLEHWRNLPENQNPMAHMTEIPYKSTGSSFGACGVRIDGNPAFVDAVLSCLKPLLDGENAITRLELARRPVDAVLEIGGESKHFGKRDAGSEVCYIRLHERGKHPFPPLSEIEALRRVVVARGEDTTNIDRVIAARKGVRHASLV